MNKYKDRQRANKLAHKHRGEVIHTDCIMEPINPPLNTIFRRVIIQGQCILHQPRSSKKTKAQNKAEKKFRVASRLFEAHGGFFNFEAPQ